MLTPAVLVTGATGGIGAVVCRKLANKNIRPIVTYRAEKESIALQLAQECDGLTLLLELSNSLSIDRAIHEISTFPIELLGIVHCSSPAPRLSSFTRISEVDMQFFWEINVMSIHRLFAGIIKHSLRKLQRGTIVALTSKAMGAVNQSAMSGMGAYTISKFGLCGVLALMAAEFSWLKVVTISPGFTQTKMLEVFDPRFIEQITFETPLSQPAEIADQILSHFEEVFHEMAS